MCGWLGVVCAWSTHGYGGKWAWLAGRGLCTGSRPEWPQAGRNGSGVLAWYKAASPLPFGENASRIYRTAGWRTFVLEEEVVRRGGGGVVTVDVHDAVYDDLQRGRRWRVDVRHLRASATTTNPRQPVWWLGTVVRHQRVQVAPCPCRRRRGGRRGCSSCRRGRRRRRCSTLSRQHAEAVISGAPTHGGHELNLKSTWQTERNATYMPHSEQRHAYKSNTQN